MPQNHSIIFTKAQLIAFLKTKGIEVGPNFTELNRLPSYATVGKFSNSLTGEHSEAAVPQPIRSEQAERSSTSRASEHEVVDASGQVFRPSRRVRQDVGGSSGQVRSLFSFTEDDSAPASASQRRALANGATAAQTATPSLVEEDDEVLTLKPFTRATPSEDSQPAQNAFRPSRRVRYVSPCPAVPSTDLVSAASQEVRVASRHSL